MNLKLDSRKRLSLANIATSDTDTYVVEVSERGVITLSPARVLTESQIAFMTDPDIRQAVENAAATTERIPYVRRTQSN